MKRLAIQQTLTGAMLVWLGVVSGCERSPDAKASSAASKPISAGTGNDNSASASDVWKDFASLAAVLGDPLLASPSQPARLPDMSEVQASANARLLEYRALQNADARVAALAAEAAEAQSEFLAAHRQLQTAGDKAEGPLLLGIGLLAGNADIAFAGLQGSVQEADTKTSMTRQYIAAFQRNRGAQLSLAGLAPKYAATASKANAITIDADESWSGLTTPYDVVKLRNDSGNDLTSCLVEVTLAGKDGMTRRNVHYVDRWPKGQWRYAQYGMGVTMLDQQLGQQTVIGLSTVAVSVWSRELRSESNSYTYSSSERDKDIRALFEGKIFVRYQLIDAGIVNRVPAIQMSLEGIELLPPCTVTIDFNKGEEKIIKSWNLDGWKKGQLITFKPYPSLPWNPTNARVRISFAQTSYVCEKILNFGEAKR